MVEIQRHDNRLGLWGWLGGGRWGVERYAYILHRLTGLGILFYFLMHVVVTSLRARGIYLWVEGGVFHQPIFKFGEFLVFAAFATMPLTASAWCSWSSASRWASPSNLPIPTRPR